ncbi:13629_t:CDS:2, partial [Gigaspora margarita]
YVAPTSLEVQKNIKEYLKKHLKDIETKKKAQKYVILGDFNVNLNQIINLDLKEQAGKKKRSRLYNCLGERGLQIFFTNLTPQDNQYENTKRHNFRTGSDHQAVFMQLKTGLNLQKRSQAKNQRVRRKKLEIDMKNANKKDWKEYQTNLSKELKRKLLKDIKKENLQRNILDH